MDFKALEAKGYTVRQERRPAYRGSPGTKTLTVAHQGGRRYFVSPCKDQESLQRLSRIQSLQPKIPHMAKICDRVDPFVLWEEAPGKLLWELEQGRPSLESIQKVLGEFVAAIGKVKLVHGDLRAWNVFFDDATKRYSVIDWGFSCFVGEPKSGDAKAHITGRNPGVEDEKVDEVDLRKTIESLKDPDRTERIWNLPPKILTWRPQAWNASRT